MPGSPSRQSRKAAGDASAVFPASAGMNRIWHAECGFPCVPRPSRGCAVADTVDLSVQVFPAHAGMNKKERAPSNRGSPFC